MKKKPSIREQREQQAAQAKKAHQQKETVRYEAARAQKEAEEATAREKEKQKRLQEKRVQLYEQRKRMEELAEQRNLNSVRQEKPSEENKSSAKAAGLKSTFILENDQLLMTSFGKGNAATPEKKIISGKIADLAEKPAFSVRNESEYTFKIDGRGREASTDNPLHRAEEKPMNREDMIHARAALERMYFGQVFEDNIHIQAIYSILDMEKSLAIHINNIVYTLNNFLRNDKDQDLMDLIGYLRGKNETYEHFMKSDGGYKEVVDEFRNLCKAKQLGYLNLEVIPAEQKKDKDGNPIEQKEDPNTIKVTEEEFFYMLIAISEMRHMLAHGNPLQNIYAINDFGESKKIPAILDKLYQRRIQELNTGFLRKARKNLAILFKAFSVRTKEQKAEYVRNYYDFTVRKEYKNTGFSIRLLREHMTAEIEEALELRNKKYDSVRGKLYPFTDFAIYRYYRLHPAEAEELVASLRASMNDKEKDEIYSWEAARIWPKKEVGNLIMHHILPEMSGENIKNLNADPDVTEDMLHSVLVTAEATVFSKMIYMLTLFINGKEINDLLTTLIHQFENVQAFISVMKSQGLNAEFCKGFELFNQSCRVANELRIINSFARMTKNPAFAKGIMYIEAFKVLGMKVDDPEELEREAKDIADPNKSTEGSKRRGVRNFIANNVIESVQFKYLVRYGNVNKLKTLAQNPALVSFVLKEIPDDQIRRYYIDIGESREQDLGIMRAALTSRLAGFSFEDIQDVRQSGGNPQEKMEKEQKKALVRLYLTVLYLALKNLVYVNSRYFLAFHCVERDRMLLNPEYWKAVESNKKLQQKPEYSFAAFAKWFLDQYPQKKRVAGYLAQNFANADNWAIGAYRNKIEHLDAIRNADIYIRDVKEIRSWYELYHYIMQRRIRAQYGFDSKRESKINKGEMVISEDRLNPKTLAYFQKVDNYKSYCKDFVKALNVPFAYNLPRYKNLSIDELFDRNRPMKKEKGSGKTEEIGEDSK